MTATITRAEASETRWTILEVTRSTRRGVLVLARCECGTEKEVVRARILRGETRSCGCKRGFWFYADRSRGDAACWLWTGFINAGGYGQLRVDGKPGVKAHRHSYELLVGTIPDGLVLDHLCRNRACVNPRHLEPVTPAENSRRGETGAHFRNDDTCRNGLHPWPESAEPGSRGRLRCAECNRVAQRAYKQRKRERVA